MLCSSNKRHSTVICKSFSLISLMQSKNLEAILIKSRDYSLGFLSDLAKNLKMLKTDTVRKLISKGVEW